MNTMQVPNTLWFTLLNYLDKESIENCFEASPRLIELKHKIIRTTKRQLRRLSDLDLQRTDAIDAALDLVAG